MQLCRNLLLIGTIFILLSGFRMYTTASDLKDLEVHFINVGQGDSILLKTPENKIILIDGGPPEGGKKLVKYLKEKRIVQIDLVIATHPDIDHIGGLLQIFDQFKIKSVMDSGKTYHTKTYKRYRNEIKEGDYKYKTLEREEYIEIDDEMTIQVLNSFEKGSRKNNAASIVLKVNYGEIDFLLMADAEMEQERKMMKQYDLEADFLKVGHHGSKTSTSQAFLEAVQPTVALLTYSRSNDYGHPVSRVVKYLQNINTDIYSTATYGNVVIKTDGESYFILPEKNPLDYLHST